MEQYQWIVNTGFAAAVAWYILTRLEPAIKQLERTVNLLAIVVAKSSGLDYDEVRREYQGMIRGGETVPIDPNVDTLARTLWGEARGSR